MVEPDDCDWDHAEFADCLARAGKPREGYWSAWSTLAWIATRDENFVAGAQLYEEEKRRTQGADFAFVMWWTLGNESGLRAGYTFTQAVVDLKEANETERLQGNAVNLQTGHREALHSTQWIDWTRSFEKDGLILVPGYADYHWSSAAARAAFVPNSAGQFVEEQLSTVQSEERQPRLTGNWINITPTAQARLAFKFFDVAKKRHLAGGADPKNPTDLRKLYVDWLKQHHSRASPYGRTTFELQLDRYEDGWRIRADGKGFEFLPD